MTIFTLKHTFFLHHHRKKKLVAQDKTVVRGMEIYLYFIFRQQFILSRKSLKHGGFCSLAGISLVICGVTVAAVICVIVRGINRR